MEKEFEEKGYWWLPENPDEKYAGTLKYIPGSMVELDIFGVFNHPFDQRIKIGGQSLSFGGGGKPERYKAIHGYAMSGKQITLFDAARTSLKTLFSSKMSMARYESSFLWRGIHCSDYNEVDIISLSTEYDILDQWLYVSAINREIKFEENKITEVSLNLADTFEHSVKIKKFNMVLNIHSRYKTNVYGRNSFEVKILPFVSFEPKKPMKYSNYYSINIHLNYLLMLFSGCPSTPIGISVKYNNKSNSNKVEDTAEILAVTGYKPKERKIKRTDILFPYSSVASGLDDYINNWFNLFELDDPLNHFFFNTYCERGLISTKLLNTIISLEGYHKRLFKEKEEFRVRIEEIIEYVRNDCIKKIIESEEDFRIQILNFRNAKSHYGLDDKKILDIDMIEQYKLMLKCRIIISTLLLRKIGVPPKLINDNLLKSHLVGSIGRN